MQNYDTSKLSIKAWAEADRPREKMLNRGRQQLSDAELIAILLGSGNRDETAVGLAQRLLSHFEQNLNSLGKSTLTELMQFKGIGEAKAISVIAALELGRRRQLSSLKEKPQIRSSRDAFTLLAPLLADLPQEQFWILLLNRANRVIGRQLISSGGVSGTVVDAKLVFKKALEATASSIILCHNHPSGNARPSQADIDITRKLKTAGSTLDITVLDHLIVCDQQYYSFADEGKL
jgi:DNA repair protein RadC